MPNIPSYSLTIKRVQIHCITFTLVRHVLLLLTIEGAVEGVPVTWELDSSDIRFELGVR